MRLEIHRLVSRTGELLGLTLKVGKWEDRVMGVGSGVWGEGSRVWGVGCRVWGVGCGEMGVFCCEQ
jgi:hypothetical protein